MGQCYPTSRTVQHYYPASDIIKGAVWTGKALEVHFWNVLRIGASDYHIDFTWQQFPHGSTVQQFAIIARDELHDSAATTRRCSLLLSRVEDYLNGGRQA